MRRIEANSHYPIDLDRLPKLWEAVFVGDVIADIQPGFACGMHNQEGVGVPHLRPMNVDREGRLDLSLVKFVPPDNPLRIKRGDILFNNTNSPELIGKTTSIEREGEWAFSNHMTRLCPPSEISPKFVAYQLHYLWVTGYFRHRCTHHVNQASIASTTLSETVPLVIAPAAEQHRIVAEIEKQFTRLDTAVAALKRTQANLKRYRASVLKAACEGRLVPTEAELARTEGRDYEPADRLLACILNERRAKWEADQLARMQAQGKTPKDDRWKEKYQEPVAPDTTDLPELPEGWVWTTVEQLASLEPNVLTDGPFGSNLKTSHYTPTGPRVIRLQNIGDGVFVDAYAHISQQHYESLEKHHIQAGDLVIAALGEKPPRACIIPPSVGPAIVKADCIRFKPEPQLALPKFLNCMLNAEPTRARTASIVHGVGRPRLNLGEIRAIILPLPPLPEQHRIVAEVERRLSVIDELESTIDADLKRAERLRQSILKRAFAGKLVPQDPNDEPASVLLERIRAERLVGATGRSPLRADHNSPAHNRAPLHGKKRKPLVSDMQPKLFR
jgi:type I restriction enzyme S subunit